MKVLGKKFNASISTTKAESSKCVMMEKRILEVRKGLLKVEIQSDNHYFTFSPQDYINNNVSPSENRSSIKVKSSREQSVSLISDSPLMAAELVNNKVGLAAYYEIKLTKFTKKHRWFTNGMALAFVGYSGRHLYSTEHPGERRCGGGGYSCSLELGTGMFWDSDIGCTRELVCNAFKEGDVVGCGYQRQECHDQRYVEVCYFFTKNGKFLKEFRRKEYKECVSDHASIAIKGDALLEFNVNFGKTKPFVYRSNKPSWVERIYSSASSTFWEELNQQVPEYEENVCEYSGAYDQLPPPYEY